MTSTPLEHDRTAPWLLTPDPLTTSAGVKVDDTTAGIAGDLNAEMWSIGVAVLGKQP